MRTPIEGSPACVPDSSSLSLLEWSSLVLAGSGLGPARHHRLLIQNLEDLADGKIDRLLVLMPPGSAKSTFVSVLFPAWWFVRHPRSSVIAASHTSDLAGHFGRQVRDVVGEHQTVLGFGLSAHHRSATRWRTSAGGEYFATGLRGPITGRRADLAIVDDPIKSFMEADRANHRDRLWNWYRAELTTRLKPGARVAVVMTRWHQDDLAGRLLETAPGEWTLLRLAALAEAGDLLGRQEGEALWPEWEDASALERKRRIVGERVWSALYQQDPKPASSRFFRTARIPVLDEAEVQLQRAVRGWDLAATVFDSTNDPDWTVGVKLGRDSSGRFVVLDLIRMRGEPHTVMQCILKAAEIDGRSVAISIPMDPGQAGKTQAADIIRQLAGYSVSATRETGSKMVRASPLATQIEAGNVAIARAQWNYALLEELGEFPFGRKDDQVDALARAFNTLAETPAPARRINASVLAR